CAAYYIVGLDYW
nr:immunoglobulin heavy chain junction region [Mus musculus]